MADREPLRTCLGCRARAGKGSLVRISIIGGVCVVDADGTVQGRGAYVHPAPDCVKSAFDRGVIPRALRARLGPQEIARLLADIEGIDR